MTLEGTVVRRKKCAVSTREAMLCAAHGRFLQESYENVGLRDIARDVGVDVALVSRYFGSKEKLFKEVLRAGKEETFRVEIDAADLPAYLASLFDADHEEDSRVHVDRLLILLRSASSPVAARIIRDSMRTDVLGPIAAMLGGEDAEARAGLSLAILMGITMMRAIMTLDTPCEGDPALFNRKLRTLFEAALAEERAPA